MVNHYPQVFVVNYRLDDFIVVFRTHAGTKLDAANHANISFQVDHIDETTRTGWSVLIQGMAEDVTDRVADPITERSRDLGVQPWVPGDKPRLVRIIPAHITGRRAHPNRPRLLVRRPRLPLNETASCRSIGRPASLAEASGVSQPPQPAAPSPTWPTDGTHSS